MHLLNHKLGAAALQCARAVAPVNMSAARGSLLSVAFTRPSAAGTSPIGCAVPAALFDYG